MQTHSARGGRRRRVLHEEARTAAGLQATTRMSMSDGAEAPRYGELAGVEHHPQITDYVPRKKRAVLAVLTGGAALAAASEALVHGSEMMASAVPGMTPPMIAGQLVGGAAAWTAAVAMLAIAGLARLVYSLRKHRVDDVRGRYRVWKHVAWAGLALSVNAVVGLHAMVKNVAVSATGWTLTASGNEWWLAPLAIVGGWIAIRVAIEASECGSALAMMMAATACYGAAAAGALGWSPELLGAWSDSLVVAAPVVGHALMLAGMMLFARYVVLDVQGLVEHKAQRESKAPSKAKAEKAEKKSEAKSTTAAPATISVTAAKGKAEPTLAEKWASDEEDDAEDEDGAYLSKSDRKRLRKQQQQRRAA